MDGPTDPRAMDLAAMDAAARDQGIVEGDAAFPFYSAMRRMLQDQHDLLDKGAAIAAGTVAAQAADELPHAIRYATFREHRTIAIVGAVAAVVLLLLVGAGGVAAGYLWRGDQALVAGVTTGKKECHLQDGGEMCAIWVWSQLPPPAAKGDK